METKVKKIAYSGIEGAFANIAAKKIFPNDTLLSFLDFESAYNSVQNGECDFAVLPIENSYAGEVPQVSDLMFNGKLFISSVYSLSVSQNLLGIKGATLNDIKTVISHPQALEQCATFIKNHNLAILEANNTARSAKQVSQQNDKTLAAIASLETAQLYGLDVLAQKINGACDNSTRFAVFSKEKGTQPSDENSTFIMMFTVENKAGTLARAINVIGKYEFNMQVLRSRPLKSRAWHSYFYVEIDGDITSEKAGKMLAELKGECEMVKILGSFKIEQIQ